jgi:hypothetical protein
MCTVLLPPSGNPIAVKYVISYHISYHIVSYHIISYRIVSYHIISYRIVSYRIISYRFVSYHIISYHIISHHITSYHIISNHIVSYRIVSYHIISYIISYHVISYHHTMSYEFATLASCTTHLGHFFVVLIALLVFCEANEFGSSSSCNFLHCPVYCLPLSSILGIILTLDLASLFLCAVEMYGPTDTAVWTNRHICMHSK